MEIGNKIKQLRLKVSLTQEQLADRLGISPQSVSKWENSVSMPDITLLPEIAEIFGVTIDELFDLTVEQKFSRIENRMDIEESLSSDVFWEYEEFLKAQLKVEKYKLQATSLLANLYHHRMTSDAKEVSKYARESIRLAPDVKDCQWLLNMAEGQTCWDWNISNHAKLIEFYKEIIANDKKEPKTPMPYYDLIDNLLADNRVDEAEKYVGEVAKLPATKPVLVEVYKAYIALGRHDVKTADAIMEKLVSDNPTNCDALFETAQYYARQCKYEKAIEFYNRSFESEPKKPRFIDAPQAISIIYEIMGDYENAAKANERVIRCLKEEWGMTEEVELRDAENELDRLKNRAI